MSEKMSLDEALAHYGVKGMKWGVRKDPSSTSTVSKLKNKVAEIPTAKKRLAIGLTGTGAAIAASMVAGPIGGAAVSSLARLADYKVVTSDISPPQKYGDNFDLVRERRGDGSLGPLVPNLRD